MSKHTSSQVKEYTFVSLDTISIKGLSLYSGIPAAHSYRMAQIFRQVWYRIPDADKQIILEYWQGNLSAFAEHVSQDNGPCLPPGGILLMDEVMYHCSDDLLEDRFIAYQATGSCWNQGNRLSFWLPALVAYPWEYAVTAVAHEIAHVYAFASKDEAHWRRVRNAAEIKAVIADQEAAARAITLRWGFNEDALDAYQGTNPKVSMPDEKMHRQARLNDVIGM